MISNESLKKRIEKIQKASLYLQGQDSYFKASNRNEILQNNQKFDWDYPISFHSLLKGIHYRNFDKNGIPIHVISGKKKYSNSMILSFGIANLQLFLRSNDQDCLDRALRQGQYCLDNATLEGNSLTLRSYDMDTESHSGLLSAMDQGEAASLFIGLYKVTQNNKWIESARRLFEIFKIEPRNGGVGYKTENSNIWVEEYPSLPLNHTLNGALFGIFGLIEFNKLTNEFQCLKNQLIEGLKEMLPKFDNGFWSNYHVSQLDDVKPYIASMKYHSLHVLQLKIINNYCPDPILEYYASKFDKYQKSTTNRLRAGLLLFNSKMSNKKP